MVSFIDIANRIRHSFHGRDWLAYGALAVIYTATRLFNLKIFPIFSDEGIYINWARIAAYDPVWRFISLTDGKQPLQTWGTIPFVRLFPEDLLLAGRLFPIVTGFIALVGVMVLVGYLWGKRTALYAGALYIVVPYFVLYDRLALVDSAVNAACIWILFLSIVLARTRRLDIAIIFGFVAGLGLLAKSSVMMFVGLSSLATLFIISPERLHVSQLTRTIYKQLKPTVDFLLLLSVSVTIAVSMYLTQKFFSPFFHYIGQKNFTFILTMSEWLSNPTQLWGNNLRIVPVYVAWESGWVLIFTGIIGLTMLLHDKKTIGWYLLLWIVLPLVVIVNFNKVIFPRYLIFFPTFFLIASAYAFHVVTQSRRIRPTGKMVFVTISLIVPIFFSIPLLTNPAAASLPPIDKGQYVIGKTAVWGADTLMQRVRDATNATDKEAIVVAEGNFGLIADVLEAMKRPTDRIDIRGKWPLNEEDFLQYQPDTADKFVFVVFSHRKEFPVRWTEEYLTLIQHYSKPEGDDVVYLFQLNPSR